MSCGSIVGNLTWDLYRRELWEHCIVRNVRHDFTLCKCWEAACMIAATPDRWIKIVYLWDFGIRMALSSGQCCVRTRGGTTSPKGECEGLWSFVPLLLRPMLHLGIRGFVYSLWSQSGDWWSPFWLKRWTRRIRAHRPRRVKHLAHFVLTFVTQN